MLPIGSKAPEFKLKLNNGEVFRLRDLYGRSNVVISFFPEDFAKSEMKETYTFLQYLQKVQMLRANVVAISPKNLDKLQEFLSSHNFTIRVASDPTLEVCRNYRVFWLKGLGLRKITYVVDKKGIVRGCLKHHLLTENSWENVMRLLDDLNSESC